MTQYGRIQSGGGVNTYFNNTQLSDVVFRTDSLTNNLVLGNYNIANPGGTKGAIYISNNSLGVKCIPDYGNYSLDVSGNANCQSNLTIGNDLNVENDVHVLNNITASNGTTFVGTAIIQNNLKRVSRIFNNVYIISYDSDRYILEVDLAYSSSIVKNALIKINASYYNVLSITKTASSIQLALDTPLTLMGAIAGSYVDVTVIRDIPDFGLDNFISTPILVSSYQYSSDNLQVIIQGTIVDDTYTSYLNDALPIHISIQPTNNQSTFDRYAGFVIISQVQYDILTMSITMTIQNIFQTPITTIDSIISRGFFSMFYTRTTTSANPIINEYGLHFGRFTSTENQTKNNIAIGIRNTNNTDLSSYTIYPISPLSFITIANHTYTVNKLYMWGSSIVMDINASASQYPIITTGVSDVTYQLIGSVVKLVSLEIITPYFILLNIDPTDAQSLSIFNQLQQTKDGMLYIIDNWFSGTTAVIYTEENTHSIGVYNPNIIFNSTPDTSAHRIVVIPYQFHSILQLGTEISDLFVLNSFAVGTNKISATDKLNVNGTLNLGNKLTFNDASGSFYQQYSQSNNYMDFNGRVKLYSDHFYSNFPGIFNGNVTASDFHQVSDQRLKTNICTSDPATDLDKILQIKVRDFSYKATPEKWNKGVIAQEVEKIIPEVVDEINGFSANVCVWACFIGFDTFILLNPETKKPSCDLDEQRFRENTEMRIIYNNVYHDIQITKFNKSTESFTFALIHSSHSMPVTIGDNFFIYGSKGTYKTVNYNYLFTMCINSIKTLHEQVQTLASLQNNK